MKEVIHIIPQTLRENWVRNAFYLDLVFQLAPEEFCLSEVGGKVHTPEGIDYTVLVADLTCSVTVVLHSITPHCEIKTVSNTRGSRSQGCLLLLFYFILFYYAFIIVVVLLTHKSLYLV